MYIYTYIYGVVPQNPNFSLFFSRSGASKCQGLVPSKAVEGWHKGNGHGIMEP